MWLTLRAPGSLPSLSKIITCHCGDKLLQKMQKFKKDFKTRSCHNAVATSLVWMGEFFQYYLNRLVLFFFIVYEVMQLRWCTSMCQTPNKLWFRPCGSVSMCVIHGLINKANTSDVNRGCYYLVWQRLGGWVANPTAISDSRDFCCHFQNMSEGEICYVRILRPSTAQGDKEWYGLLLQYTQNHKCAIYIITPLFSKQTVDLTYKNYRAIIETHPSPGMRSHWPVIPAIRLLWTIITPLGLPVEPLVYITIARSRGWGFTISLSTASQIHRKTVPFF